MKGNIIYTESGKDAIEKYLEEQKKIMETKICEEKYVFGDSEIEITASDIHLYIKHSFFEEMKIKRRKSMAFLSQSYIIIGVIMVVSGVLFPIIVEMFESNPLQFMLTVAGSILAMVGGIIWLFFYRKYK